MAIRKTMRTVAVACAVTTLGLAGCGVGSEGGVARGEAAQTEPAKGETVQARAASLYRGVLEDPARYFDSLRDEDRAKGTQFSYALVAAAKGDLPVLLVRATGPEDSWNGVAEIIPLMVDGDAQEIIPAVHSYTDGVAGAGGFRWELDASRYGDGLIWSETSSGSGEGTIRRLIWDGSRWDERLVCDTQVGDDSGLQRVAHDEMVEIPWVELSLDDPDMSQVDALANGAWEPTGIERDATLRDVAEGMSLTVLEGTVHWLDACEIAELQGVENPDSAADGGPKRAVIVLDSPCEVTAMNGDGTGERTGEAKMVLIDAGNTEELWGAYKDERVTIAVDSSRMIWPSDASLPLGEPRVLNGGVLVLAASRA